MHSVGADVVWVKVSGKVSRKGTVHRTGAGVARANAKGSMSMRWARAGVASGVVGAMVARSLGMWALSGMVCTLVGARTMPLRVESLGRWGRRHRSQLVDRWHSGPETSAAG
jgi:hypothetical protein